MLLNNLYSSTRTGENSKRGKDEPRSAFQRDFDRLIFSSSFRRLQNKTQVFPLPGSVFVHNRLTHSLEVASVGRSLGSIIGKYIIEQYPKELTEDSIQFYNHSLYNVLASACLCHDIGNPAFGHSGEDAIANFFRDNEGELKNRFSEREWADFINFEGNANAIRVLTNTQNGKSKGGLKLTYSTLSAIAKYPCESIATDKDVLHRKKFGFFNSCKPLFRQIALETNMIQHNEEPLIFLRHPFVWLTELADDICYHIIDLEDAHKLKIVSFEICRDMLKNLISCLQVEDIGEFEKRLDSIKDQNEKITFLRAKAINSLIMTGKDIYIENFNEILNGEFYQSIFDIIADNCPSLQNIIKYSRKYIYNNRSVVEIENAGYSVMFELLQHFINPILKDKGQRRTSDDKALKLIPNQFLYDSKSDYEKVMGVLDYVSGMTDNYAVELFKKIKGIEIGMKI